MTQFLGREKYAREGKASENQRHGFYSRNYAIKDIGELNIKVPRDRKGKYRSTVIAKYDRYEPAIANDICLMYLSGLSTRGIKLVSKSILGRKISHGEVSNENKELMTGLDAWRCKSLSELPMKYTYIDGVNLHMRGEKKIELLPMLVVIGVGLDNRKTFLASQKGDKEVIKRR